MLAGKKAAGDALRQASNPKEFSASFSAQVFEELRRFVEVQFELELTPERVNLPFSELGLDSFSLLELVVFVERKFGIKVPLELLTADNLSSISSLAQCVAAFVEGNEAVAKNPE